MQSNYTSEAALVEPGLYLLPPWSRGAQIGIRASRGHLLTRWSRVAIATSRFL